MAASPVSVGWRDVGVIPPSGAQVWPNQTDQKTPPTASETVEHKVDAGGQPRHKDKTAVNPPSEAFLTPRALVGIERSVVKHDEQEQLAIAGAKPSQTLQNVEEVRKDHCTEQVSTTPHVVDSASPVSDEASTGGRIDDQASCDLESPISRAGKAVSDETAIDEDGIGDDIVFFSHPTMIDPIKPPSTASLPTSTHRFASTNPIGNKGVTVPQPKKRTRKAAKPSPANGTSARQPAKATRAPAPAIEDTIVINVRGTGAQGSKTSDGAKAKKRKRATRPKVGGPDVEEEEAGDFTFTQSSSSLSVNLAGSTATRRTPKGGKKPASHSSSSLKLEVNSAKAAKRRRASVKLSCPCLWSKGRLVSLADEMCAPHPHAHPGRSCTVWRGAPLGREDFVVICGQCKGESLGFGRARASWACTVC